MSNADNYLKELLDMELKQGIALLRSVAAQFSTTLDRLPRIKQEIDVMLEPGQELNYERLAASLERSLDKAAGLLGKVDLLTDETFSDSKFAGFLTNLQNTMTLRTIDTWHDAFTQEIEEAKRPQGRGGRKKATEGRKRSRADRSAEAIEQKKIENMQA